MLGLNKRDLRAEHQSLTKQEWQALVNSAVDGDAQVLLLVNGK